jgi:hypothetical protein
MYEPPEGVPDVPSVPDNVMPVVAVAMVMVDVFVVRVPEAVLPGRNTSAAPPATVALGAVWEWAVLECVCPESFTVIPEVE